MKFLSLEGLAYFYAKVKAFVKNDFIQKTDITTSAEASDPNKVVGSPLANDLQKQINTVNSSLASVNATLTKRTHGFQVSQTLLMPGWYRVTTMLFGSDSLAQFSHAYSWTMQINTTYWNQTNMSVTLLFNMAWQKYQVTALGKAINMQQITKIRVSRNTANNVVIDIYYVYAYQNFVNIAIDNIRGGFINSFSSDVFAIESLQAVADTDLTTLIEYEIM